MLLPLLQNNLLQGGASGSVTQEISVTLDGIGFVAQQIGPPDRLIQVITGNVRRMRDRYEEEKRKLEEVFVVTEVAPNTKRRSGTLTLEQLIGKTAAGQINAAEVEGCIQARTQARRRRQDDDLMLMM